MQDAKSCVTPPKSARVPGNVAPQPKSSTARNLLKRAHKESSSSGLKVARCLFGPPDPKQSSDMVREMEETNAITFSRRFNFDIVQGEPIPASKKVKLSHLPSSTPPSSAEQLPEKSPEQVQADAERADNETDKYVWSQVYNLDDLDMCNIFFRVVSSVKTRNNNNNYPRVVSSNRRSLFVGTL